MSRVLINPETGATAGLTPRDLDVLAGIAAGNTNAAIGRRLRLSEDTVKRSVAKMLRLWDANDRAQLVAAAFKAGVLEAEVDRPQYRLPQVLTERFVLACGCGRGLGWRDMHREPPTLPSGQGSLTLRPIVCEACFDAGIWRVAS